MKTPATPVAESAGTGEGKGESEAPPALDIVFDEAVAQGVYANLIMLAHGESEFVIDFIFLQPQAPRAKVRSRILLSDRHAKRLLHAGQENLRYFEKHFGAITPAPTPPPLNKPSGTFH
ncbi:MAG: DUF3467 domain-containing protein [Desulfuromonas sp.]|nr:MAG: DUF3467 domain-containing protein [Desulfuromonas sp.]